MNHKLLRMDLTLLYHLKSWGYQIYIQLYFYNSKILKGIAHSPNGHLFGIYSDQEYSIYRS